MADMDLVNEAVATAYKLGGRAAVFELLDQQCPREAVHARCPRCEGQGGRYYSARGRPPEDMRIRQCEFCDNLGVLMGWWPLP